MKKLFVVVLSLISFTAFSQAPTGKIVVKKGQQFIVESTVDAVSSQEMMGQSMEMKIGSLTKMSAEIKDTKDNNYLIAQTITSVKSTYSGMGQDKSFDSDKKEDLDGELGAIYKDKINVPTLIIMTPEGKSVLSADTSKNDEEANPMIKMMEVMGGQQNAGAVLFLVIPAGKKTGDSWQDSSSTNGIQTKRTYTINSIKNSEVSVTMNSVMDINKTMQVQNMEMKMALISKITSAVLVDLVSNIQKENKSTTEVAGTLDIMGQSVPMTSKVTTVTTVKSK